ncbi:hypothetical protein GQ55_2G159300 [Panicum hallii var. hallii]|uniref:Uncharacterized protein n=1 Tax=Panicum hallii var. hallii TaxID=1504633 RepID=A0A2T7EPW5_9POAL|nr:hypothetical protein GQ55_2G159300 [Panicum hallii var. hallii]
MFEEDSGLVERDSPQGSRPFPRNGLPLVESWPGPNYWAFGSPRRGAGAPVPIDFPGAGAPPCGSRAPPPPRRVPESKAPPSLRPSASPSKPRRPPRPGRTAPSYRRVVRLPQLPVLRLPVKTRHRAALPVQVTPPLRLPVQAAPPWEREGREASGRRF